MKNCSRVLSRGRVAEKSNRSVQLERLSHPHICKPCLYLYNHLTLSISIFSPLWLFYPLTQPVSFASLLSLYPPLWQLFPTLLCRALFSFILSCYQYHSFLFFPLLPRDRRHWEHGSCLSFTLVVFFSLFFLLTRFPLPSFSLELGTSCCSILSAISSFFLFISNFLRW